MIQYNTDTCNHCHQEKLIVNRTHALCASCNRIRLDSQKDPNQLAEKKKKQYASLKTNSPLKQNKPLRSRTRIKVKKRCKVISSQQKIVASKLKQVYTQLEIPQKCSGCGTFSTLTHSHIIRRSLRKDLECDSSNITYHCLENNCHSLWESNDIKRMSTLADFHRNMLYIKKVDQALWTRLLSQIDGVSGSFCINEPPHHHLMKRRIFTQETTNLLQAYLDTYKSLEDGVFVNAKIQTMYDRFGPLGICFEIIDINNETQQ